MTSPETVPTDGPRCCQLTCRQVRTEYIASSTPYTVHLHLVTRAVHIFALMLIPFEPDRPTLQFVTPTRVVAAGVGDGNRFCRGPSNQGGMRTEKQPRRTYVAHPDDTVAPHGYWPLTICQLRQYRRNQTSQMPSHPPKMTGGSSPRRNNSDGTQHVEVQVPSTLFSGVPTAAGTAASGFCLPVPAFLPSGCGSPWLPAAAW